MDLEPEGAMSFIETCRKMTETLELIDGRLERIAEALEYFLEEMDEEKQKK